MRCRCGGEAIRHEGEVICIDGCTLFWPTDGGPAGDDLVPAGDASNMAGEGCDPAGDGE